MHYKNGRLAKVGDPVIGTTFNYTAPGSITAGTLVACTPGPDSCSAMVGFLITVPADADGNLPKGCPKVGSTIVYSATPVTVQGTEQHGSAGPKATTFYVQDYTECKHLLHAEDAHLLSQPITATIQAIDYGDLIDQEKKAHEERRGTSGKSPEYEEGYLQAHDSIKGLIAQAQEAIKPEPGALLDDGPALTSGNYSSPPIDNAHVAEGCEQFVGSKAE